jgi:hypothetical protein
LLEVCQWVFEKNKKNFFKKVLDKFALIVYNIYSPPKGIDKKGARKRWKRFGLYGIATIAGAPISGAFIARKKRQLPPVIISKQIIIGTLGTMMKKYSKEDRTRWKNGLCVIVAGILFSRMDMMIIFQRMERP